jgi:multidrug efflux pump subunit AcrA (membrane-fusion protein)
VAWLELERPCVFSLGDFLTASITTGSHRVLALPEKAVLVLAGAPVAVRRGPDKDGKAVYETVTLETGAAKDGLVEVRSGLKAGDQAVISGAIGYLYPDFKSSAGD